MDNYLIVSGYFDGYVYTNSADEKLLKWGCLTCLFLSRKSQ